MSTRQYRPESIDRSPARTPEGVTDSVPGEPETFGAPGAGGAGGELTAESLQPVLHRLALAMPLATSDQPFGPEHTVYRAVSYTHLPLQTGVREGVKDRSGRDGPEYDDYAPRAEN